MPCSLKLHDLITCSPVTPSWTCVQFDCQSSMGLPSFVVCILPFPFFILLSISCLILGYLALLSTFPVETLVVFCNISWYFSTALPKFPLSHSCYTSFCSRVSGAAVCHLTFNIFRSNLGFLLELNDFLQSNADLQNHLIVSASVFASGIVCACFILFLNRCLEVISPTGVSFELLVLSRCTVFS